MSRTPSRYWLVWPRRLDCPAFGCGGLWRVAVGAWRGACLGGRQPVGSLLSRPGLWAVLSCGLADLLCGDPVEPAVAELADVVAERLQGPLTLGVLQAS
jgi:hypothetical protein